MAVRSLITVALLLVFLAPAIVFSSTSVIGINYGQIADNLPSPSSVVPLLRSLGVSRVKLYDADPAVLRAFAGTGVEFVVGLPNGIVAEAAVDPAVALAWVKSNVEPHAGKTKIAAVTVGNEVLSGNDTVLIRSLLPAMQSIHSALATLGLDRHVAVTTAHSLAVLAASYPPSAAVFRRDLLKFIAPILQFLAKTRSPFLINAYPYFAYKADPRHIPLDYVLSEPTAAVVVDPATGLRYGNMLHAQVDAVRFAIAVVNGGGRKAAVEVVVSETGWPSDGDEDEAGATPENARRYNGNLIGMAAEGKGTPMRPGEPLSVYVFALFNENLKPGPASERHYGLFKPDGTPAYEIAGVTGSSGNVTDSRGGGNAESPSQAAVGATTKTSYYTISSAAKSRRFVAAAASAATMVGLVLHLG